MKKAILPFLAFFILISCRKHSTQPMVDTVIGGCILPVNFEKIRAIVEDPSNKVEWKTHNLIWPYNIKGGDHPKGHPGIDFSGPDSCEIKAIHDGAITWVGKYVNTESGWVINEKIDSNISATYQLVSIPIVVEGQKVTKGQTIGYMYADLINKTYGNNIHFAIMSKLDQPDNADDSQVRCPLKYFNDEAKSQINYLLKHSIGREEEYIDQNKHYKAACF